MCPYFVNVWVKFDVKDCHAVTLSKHECREIRCGECNTLFASVRGKFPFNVGIFRPIAINIGTRNIYEMLLSDFFIHENRQEKEFISIFITFLFRFVWNSVQRIWKQCCFSRVKCKVLPVKLLLRDNNKPKGCPITSQTQSRSTS
jgi:hypothetical protein